MKPLVLSLFALSIFLLTVPSSAQEQSISGKALIPPREFIFGRTAKIESTSGKLKGELLSVSQDSLWVLGSDGMFGLALNELRGVDVRMHKWGTNRVVMWNLVAGLGSALALTVACNSVDGTSGCGGVFLGWSVSWGLIGGLAGTALALKSHRKVPTIPDALRPYVRYPQGLPTGARPPERGGTWPGGGRN